MWPAACTVRAVPQALYLTMCCASALCVVQVDSMLDTVQDLNRAIENKDSSKLKANHLYNALTRVNDISIQVIMSGLRNKCVCVLHCASAAELYTSHPVQDPPCASRLAPPACCTGFVQGQLLGKRRSTSRCNRYAPVPPRRPARDASRAPLTNPPPPSADALGAVRA